MKMLQKKLALLLSAFVVLAVIPFSVSASTSQPIWVGGIEMRAGEYLANGAIATTDKKPTGGYAYYKEGILTLSNYEYKGSEKKSSATIFCAGDITVNLEGYNSIVFDGTNWENCAILSDGDLIVCGNGTITINNFYMGLYSNNDVIINGGNIIIPSNSGIGIVAIGSIMFNSGNLNFGASTIGLCSDDGDITINSGNINIAASYYAIYTNNKLTINGGSLIAKSFNLEKDSKYCAINVGGIFTIGDDLFVKAAASPHDELGEFLLIERRTYDYIVISDCDCNCHQNGISNFFFKIALFFQKIFGLNTVCSCGLEHLIFNSNW